MAMRISILFLLNYDLLKWVTERGVFLLYRYPDVGEIRVKSIKLSIFRIHSCVADYCPLMAG